MADCAFTTNFSRRTILAGGTAAIAAPAFGLPAGAAAGGKPDPLPALNTNPDPNSDPDAELLRLMAVAARRWRDYTATRAAWARGFDALVGHPDYPDMARVSHVTPAIRARWADLAGRTGYTAAAECRDAAHARYAAAANTAFAIPALTLRGLRAKLRFAATAAMEGGDPESPEIGEYGWLERALADLERLAARSGA